MFRDDQPDSPETLTGVETNEFLTILVEPIATHYIGVMEFQGNLQNIPKELNSVNGKFSDWGQWSSCIVNSGCQGNRERERPCNTPAPQHGGIHCTGSVEKQEACNSCT
ncbi:complement component C8 beta chain-like [Mytilus edulis]|uniref:complement component C8 beta chain-like n=1 Tax=Mytilus edulis TaxID=6550 RepID=UPI0039EF6E48